MELLFAGTFIPKSKISIKLSFPNIDYEAYGVHDCWKETLVNKYDVIEIITQKSRLQYDTNYHML